MTNLVFANARVLLVGHEAELGPVEEDGLIDVDGVTEPDDDVQEAELVPARPIRVGGQPGRCVGAPIGCSIAGMAQPKDHQDHQGRHGSHRGPGAR